MFCVCVGLSVCTLRGAVLHARTLIVICWPPFTVGRQGIKRPFIFRLMKQWRLTDKGDNQSLELRVFDTYAGK